MKLLNIWRHRQVVFFISVVMSCAFSLYVLMKSRNGVISPLGYSTFGFHAYSNNEKSIVAQNGTTVKKIPKLLLVLGTRPEGIKCAPLIKELKSPYYATRFELLTLSTGQHREILKQTLAVFDQTIDFDLNLMVHDQQLSDLFARVFSGVIAHIDSLRPNMLLVQGDTTTALAAALAAAYRQVPVAHVEAGLRSFDISSPYPEEINRRIIDSISKLMFAPTTFAREALVREGACPNNVFVTGNTGVDAFYAYNNRTLSRNDSMILRIIDEFRKNFTTGDSKIVILVTMHRRENFPFLPNMCRAIASVAKDHRRDILFLLPIHPNPNVKNVVMQILDRLDNVKIVHPISYDVFGHVLLESDIVMTDSGGIQEEAVSIGKPVILMRITTERPEGIYLGTIRQVGTLSDDIIEAVNLELKNVKSKDRKALLNIFGDGTASKQIAEIIDSHLNESRKIYPQCITKFRQDSIAKTVYNRTRLAPPNIAPHAMRQAIMQNLTRVRPTLTLDQLLKLPSRYNMSVRNDESFSLTAVIGLYRREGLVRRWIEALLLQTHLPKEIWIVHFASPVVKQIQDEIAEVKSFFRNGSDLCYNWCKKSKCHTNDTALKVESQCATHCEKLCSQLPSILFVAMGEMQLKYFGRFQLALQIQTKYLIVFDDDCIPQRRYFETAMHVINTKDYRGILGTKGVPAVENAFYGPMSRSKHIIEVDLVGGSWLMESQWAKLMFHDKMFSWSTGEDFHLAANARKYANIRSFVMPVDEMDHTTHSFSEDYMGISMRGDTTGRVAGTNSARQYIREQLWLRGDRWIDSFRSSKPSLLLFAENQDDAMVLLNYSKQTMITVGGLVHFVTSDEKKSDLNAEKIKRTVQSYHDFMLGRNYDSDVTPIITAAEVFYAFDMVMQGTQSTVVMIVGSSTSVAMFAFVVAAFIRNIPVVNIYMSDHIVDLKKAEAINHMASFNILISNKTNSDHSQDAYLKEVLTSLYG